MVRLFSLALSLLLVLSACGSRVIVGAGATDAAIAGESGVVDVTIDQDVAAPFDAPIAPVDAPIAPVDAVTPRDLVLPRDLPGIDAPTPGPSCEAATPLPIGAERTLVVSGRGETLVACPSIPPHQPSWFTATVPPASTLVVTTTTLQPGQFVAPQILLGCSMRSCVGAPEPMGSTTTFAARWSNTTPGARQVIVAVGAAPGADVPYRLLARLEGASVSENLRCAAATELRPGVPVSGTLSVGGDVPEACGTEGAALPGQFFRVVVPAGQTLSARFTPVGALRRGVALRVARRCGGACVAASSAFIDGGVVARWTNPDPSGAEVIVSLAPTSSAGAAQDYSLVATLSPTPTNVRCAGAVEVRDGLALRGVVSDGAVEVQPPCPGMTGGGAASLYYTALVPQGQSLFVSATADATGRAAPAIRVIPACGSNVCLAASTIGTSSAAAFNNAGPAQRVFIAVGFADARLAAPFTLSFSIRPPATNGLCRSALRVMNGSVATAASLGDGREAPLACAIPGREGSALYYAVRVPPGEQLTVLAGRVETGVAPTVRLFGACGETTCLAQSTPSGTAARLDHTNAGSAPQELVFAVNLRDGGASPAALVNVAVSVARPAYAVSVIRASCDPGLSAVVAGAQGDDVGTPSQPMPFAFDYFGSRVSAWSVSTNGYLQLWAASGASAGALGPRALPSSTAPLGMVAPFWDDLIVTPGVGDIRSGSSDAGGRHFTVQWTNAQFCCNQMGADRLTFQVKLFQQSGAVEFHYCELAGVARVNGANAAIGMQDTSALRGVTFALRRADAVATGAALRFTP